MQINFGYFVLLRHLTRPFFNPQVQLFHSLTPSPTSPLSLPLPQVLTPSIKVRRAAASRPMLYLGSGACPPPRAILCNEEEEQEEEREEQGGEGGDVGTLVVAEEEGGGGAPILSCASREEAEKSAPLPSESLVAMSPEACKSGGGGKEEKERAGKVEDCDGAGGDGKASGGKGVIGEVSFSPSTKLQNGDISRPIENGAVAGVVAMAPDTRSC